MTSCTSSRANDEQGREEAAAGGRPASPPPHPLRHGLRALLFYSLFFTAFFAPVLFTNHLLAPGDGVIFYAPNFYAQKKFWDDLLLAGNPMIADPQVIAWYPPALLFSHLLPGGWNAFMVSAYVLAAAFTYGYLYTLTRSRFAALLSGIVYGLSGFMMAHLGHSVMIHSAVWLPLIVWAFERLRARLTARWIGAGAGAIACGALAGHTQVFIYTLIVAAFYVVVRGWGAPVGRWRYYPICFLVTVLGTGLAALQLLPAFELSHLSLRAQLDFSNFVTHALPLSHLPLLLFPFVFGGTPGYGAAPYFGAWNLTELTCYVGLLPLMLIAAGLIAGWRSSPVLRFWAGVGLLAFLIALGDATPLARIIYGVPILNLFRIPSRHFFEVAFAASVLAGLGGAAVLRERPRGRLIHAAIFATAALPLAALLGLYFHPAPFTPISPIPAEARANLLPWVNPAVGVPMLIFAAAAVALLSWQRRPRSHLRKALVLIMVTLDLASFGWFYEWLDRAPRREILSPPSFAARYRDDLTATNQRLLPMRGGLGAAAELPPTLSRLWGVPSASGYGPLIMTRTSRLLEMPPHGVVTAPWINTNDLSLDLSAVRYLFLPRGETVIEAGESAWLDEEMDISLGAGCITPHPDSFSVELPAPVPATALGIVSLLACSTHVPDEAEVLRLQLTDVDGTTRVETLAAGRDTSEWAFDCRDVRPHVKHRRAPIFRSFPIAADPQPCAGHEYAAEINLSGMNRIRRLDLRWVGPAGAKISIKKMRLLNRTAGRAYLIKPPLSTLLDYTRWRHVEDFDRASVFENTRVMPRAWLAAAVVTMTPDEALRTIKSSRLPDGSRFEPRQTALVEEPLSLAPAAAAAGGAGTAQVSRLAPGLMEVRTTTSGARPAFLVTSDAAYPGWRATIDGAPARLYHANYALRGVVVPAGSHVVRFELSPVSFYYGSVVSLLSLVLLVALIILCKRHRNAE